MANLILVFALRICCLHAEATHRFFFFYKPDKVRGFRQTVCPHVSPSPHQRTLLSHLQGHQRYQGGSEVSWSPHRYTHTYTQVGNYNINFMSTRSTGRTCNSESHQEMCNSFKYEGIWSNCVWIQPFSTTFHARGGLLCENTAKSPKSRERGHKKWKANIKDIGEKCDIVLGNVTAF